MTLRREPAAWAALVIALLSALATVPNPLINNEQVPLWVAAIDAVLALLVALKVKPIAPSVVTAVISAVAVLLAGYRAPVPHDLIAAVNAFVVPAVLGLIARSQQSPTSDPAPTAPREGPVR